MARVVVAIAAAILIVMLAEPARTQDVESVQLVGNFDGITCEPDDPVNNMQLIEAHLWRKLVFIDQPGSPDTVYFKYTMNGSYLPLHWGWSGVWGIAELAWNPPSIVAMLPDSGYHYFYFNDSDYSYWIEQPSGIITGTVTADGSIDVPNGAIVTLFDSLYNVIGTFSSWADASYYFDNLCSSVYILSAYAPGYRDTVITDIHLAQDETKNIPISLTPLVGVLIASAECHRVEGGVAISWCTLDCSSSISFDVYRAYEPNLLEAVKRNSVPVSANGTYEFLDPCDDPTKDLYYYLVEIGDDDPTRYGPILVEGVSLAAFLGQNYPNPFNPSTVIPYTVSAAGAGKSTTISFYDASGRLVDRYDLGIVAAGAHSFRWNPMASNRGGLPSGVYYCRLAVGKEVFSRKLVLLR